MNRRFFAAKTTPHSFCLKRYPPFNTEKLLEILEQKSPGISPNCLFPISVGRFRDFLHSSIVENSQDEEPFTLEDLTGLPSRSSKVSLGLVAPGSVLKDVGGQEQPEMGGIDCFIQKAGMVVMN